uniref:PDZ domain-containing protein n=1 Tax=Amphimedon queenslandica TaxID=400682 RepID=A0A1X7TA63_AMPQE
MNLIIRIHYLGSCLSFPNCLTAPTTVTITAGSSSTTAATRTNHQISPGQGLGLSIVGGRGSPTGDVPIYVKRILPESVLQKDSKIKTGHELVAVNDLMIHNVYYMYVLT